MSSVQSEPDPVAALSAAFPRSLTEAVSAIVGIVPAAAASLDPVRPFRVSVAGSPVAIPYRIYSAEPADTEYAALTRAQQAMLDCLYTRHHDGYVRQRRLERVIGLAEPWVAPFVVQLVGEYVEEILLVIRRELVPALNMPDSVVASIYARFAAENPDFIDRTEQRVVSYWNCYYRNRYSLLRDYPGSAVTAALRSAGHV
ncbi:hypothetical protein AB0I55_24580 [Actinocatenispora sera]|uniref:hypothetical protein n=1 Tax=Actinocatenispora sera TaxID=390989 RepID=UPI0033F6E5A5